MLFVPKIILGTLLVPNRRTRAPFESKLSLRLEASPGPLNIRNWHFKGDVITSDWIWSFRDFASFSLLGRVILVFSIGHISFWDHTKPTHFVFPLSQLVQVSLQEQSRNPGKSLCFSTVRDFVDFPCMFFSFILSLSFWFPGMEWVISLRPKVPLITCGKWTVQIILYYFVSCVFVSGVCALVCVIQRSVVGVFLSYSPPVCFGRGSPIDSRAHQFRWADGSRDPPGSNAPSLSVYRHKLSHPASVGAGIQTQVLSLHSHHLTNWVNSTASVSFYFWGNILLIGPCWTQIPKLQRFFCFSLLSDGAVGAQPHSTPPVRPASNVFFRILAWKLVGYVGYLNHPIDLQVSS